MSDEFVIRGKRVVTTNGEAPASIHVRDGKIARMSAFDDAGDGEIIECGDDVLMAGLVDSHVHVNEPGRTEWEGFETATRAAAAGGVTTIVDMPLNSTPPTTTIANLQTKLAALEGKCSVDVGLWGGAIPGNTSDLRSLLDAGVLGFKCFLVDSGVEEFPHLDASGLEAALKELNGTGAPLLVHAELAGPIERARVSGVPRSYERYLLSRPDAAEIEAIELVAETCARTNGRAHIVHLSAAGGIDVIRRARERGIELTAETTPHYLHLEAETIPDGATEYKCAPPIRDAVNRERLWEALAEGTIELVVSDHSPCTPQLKRKETGDFANAWGGIASLQLLLPVVWTETRKRGFELSALTRWMSEAPARLAGLSPRKGRLLPGLDADFVVWNPDATFLVEPSMIRHRHTLTPYAGESLYGTVSSTWVRGRRVYGSGEFYSPSGEWIRGRNGNRTL